MRITLKIGLMILVVIGLFSPIGAGTALSKDLSSSDSLLSSRIHEFPSLSEFILKLSETDSDGLWSQNRFAYIIQYNTWGFVPEVQDTISFARYDQYKGFFIHDYLGGAALYDIQNMDEIAFVSNGDVTWFRITGKWLYEATPNGKKCGISAPYYDITSSENSGVQISTERILERHYLNPLTIQTCLCSSGINGVQILVGDWIPAPSLDFNSIKISHQKIDSQQIYSLV